MRHLKVFIITAIFFSMVTGTVCRAAAASPIENEPETSSNTGNNGGLDVLKHYDHDIWDGPEGWTAEQWKMQLTHAMNVPGAYQGLYLFNPQDKPSKQRALGLKQIRNNPFDI